MLRALSACVLLLSAGSSLAAESYDACAGTITSLPAVISTQGVWCLRADLSTAINSGFAITIATNNVTLDCNGFKIGGLQAGPSTEAQGILSLNHSNVTIRNCNVRGFLVGLRLLGGSGHVVEDNRFEGNTNTGIAVGAADVVQIRRNLVANTGGSYVSQYQYARGISVETGRAVLVQDNFVSEVGPDGNLWPNAQGFGITVDSSESVVEHNRVAGVSSGPDTIGAAYYVRPAEIKIIDNTASGSPGQVGFECGNNEIFSGNLVSGSAPGPGFVNCADDGGNISR